jgi:hypothetical protein
VTEAAPTTVEALMYELRTEGLAALKALNCRRRLSALSRNQLEEGLRRLITIRGRSCCPGITDELLVYIERLTK